MCGRVLPVQVSCHGDEVGLNRIQGTIAAIVWGTVATSEFSADEEVDSADEAAFWLGVSSVPHIGPVRIERLVSRFGSLRRAWSAPEHQLSAVLESRPLTELLTSRAAVDPRREIERLQARGID